MSLNTVSKGFLETVGLRTVEGNLAALSQPNSIALSRSQAARLGVHAGDILWLGDQEEKRVDTQHEVVALYEDFPANSSFAHIVAVTDVGDRDMTPSYWNDCYFVRLHAGPTPTSWPAAGSRFTGRTTATTWSAWPPSGARS